MMENSGFNFARSNPTVCEYSCKSRREFYNEELRSLALMIVELRKTIEVQRDELAICKKDIKKINNSLKKE